MLVNLLTLPVEERIQIVEDLWDSIAVDQEVLSLTNEQKNELDFRLNNYKIDGNKGRKASEVIADIRNKL